MIKQQQAETSQLALLLLFARFSAVLDASKRQKSLINLFFIVSILRFSLIPGVTLPPLDAFALKLFI
jgi:hypothetical protein